MVSRVVRLMTPKSGQRAVSTTHAGEERNILEHNKTMAGSGVSTRDISVEVFDPTGAVEVSQLHAPRLADLNGKVVCELANAHWEDYRILEAVRRSLLSRFPDVTIVPYTEFPYGYEIDDERVAAMVKEKGAHAVVLASAG